ncbi:MAG: hypothetical protein ACOYT4_03790 [Nanoarchaeota archaeon]
MLSEILKEKISADHLLYVSLKYTKTCDVILNLIARWTSLIDLSFDAILQRAFENKKIPSIPKSPKERIEFLRKYFKKEEAIQEIIPLYIFFRRIPELNKTREGDFRKNVTLKIIEPNKVTEINMDKLKEYASVLERFISAIKYLLK